MLVCVENSFLSGKIKAISSKSYAHRSMICDFLCGELPDVTKFNSSNDILATYNCIKDILDGKTLLDAGESGSTLRFMLPLLCAIGGNFTIKMGGKLPSRPNEELFCALKSNGIDICQVGDKICLSGKLKAGKFSIRGDISSQYISGLLMALCLLDGESQIQVTSPISSRPYVDITLEVLSKYGAKIVEENNIFTVYGGQKLKKIDVYEGDWSNSAFFLVAGVINGDLEMTGLNVNSNQGDKKIIDIIKKANGNITIKENSVIAKKSHLVGFTFDAEDVPDLVPICAVLASCCEGESLIKNISRLRLKESDRILSTMQMLSNCGIKCQLLGDDLKVYGGQVLGGKVDSFNDHRIAMSSAIFALNATNEIIIDGAEAVNKSYPKFFEDYASLNGRVYEKI